MHFPPVSDSPYFRTIFGLWGKFCNFTFSRNFFTCFTCVSFPPLLWPWCIYALPNARTGRPCQLRSKSSPETLLLETYSFCRRVAILNFMIFIRRNFWRIFFSHRPQISNFPPIFPVSIHFPPVSQKLFFLPPTLTNSPCFRQIHLLFTYFTCIFVTPTLTMMHLCITQCTYWTPLVSTQYFGQVCASFWWHKIVFYR